MRQIARAARHAEIRLRLNRGLRWFVGLLPVPLVYSVGVLTYIKAARPGVEREQLLLYMGAALLVVPVAGMLLAYFAKRSKHLGAMALDRHHGLADRLTSALSFTAIEQDKRSELMNAAIVDATEKARGLKPRRAAPINVPRELPIVAFLIASLVGIALLEVRTIREIPPEPTFKPMVMTADDLDLFKDMAKDLEKNSQDPEVQAAIRRFNQLIEDIAAQRQDRTEVFKRLEELERDLLKGAEADKEAMQEGLKGLAKELEKSDLTKPIAKGLKEKNLADAEKAMRELAEKLKNKKNPPTKAQLDKLRGALKKASKNSSERLKRIEAQRKKLEEEKKRLLKKKKKQDGGLSKRNRKLLNKKERQLERLNREKNKAKRAQRQLSRLDRELAKAAADLMKELGLSAEDLENAAQDINRMAQEEMTDKEKQELRKRLQQMKELLRQQGKGGKQRLQRLLKFGQRARGGKGGKGQKGQGKGKGQKGQGNQPGGSGKGLMIGQGSGGKTVPIPGMGQGTGPGAGQMPGQGSGQGGGDKPGAGGGKGGKSWGTGHDSNLKGEASNLKGQTKDVTAAAADTGEGTASSQVIYGASERGFTGRGYKKVYTDYKTVAEQVMNQDQIPPGYRFYVQRYFQLIRPRE